MKLLKIALVVSLVLLAVYYYVDNYVASHPLMGVWKSDRELSLKEYYAVGISAEQEAALKASLGKKTLRITKDQWMSSYEGKNEIFSYFIASEDGSCFVVKKKLKPAETACVEDGLLYVPGTIEGSREVYVRL
ncbi:MAG: hypothetical protein AAFN78_08110 [Pseudomonadota bacterium]